MAVSAVLCLLSVPSMAQESGSPDEQQIMFDDQVSGEDLVLQIVIDRTTMEEFVGGISQDGRYYLALGELSALLDLAITVDAENMTAEGWFIRETNTISLTKDQVVVNDETSEIAQGSMIARDGDLFIDSTLLQKWLPIDFTVDLPGMLLNIATRESLPYQEALWRKKMQTRLMQKQKDLRSADAKMLDTPYKVFQFPSIDLSLSPSYDKPTRTHRKDYSVLATGDLGYLSTRLYFAGNPGERDVTNVSLNLGRTDFKRRLMGPLRASSFLMGDINSAIIEQVATADKGRGFTITNRALDRPDNFDITSFIGDSKPGWEVELYRNDTLLDFQTVGDDGRYEFREVPILFGNNVFRLSFYGPQGQREEILKTVNASASLLEQGDLSYNLSMDQKDRSVFSSFDSSTLDSGKQRVVGAFEYGITRKLTATAGVMKTSIDGEPHLYLAGGLRANLGESLVAVDHAFDDGTAGYSTRMSAFMQFKGVNMQFQQKVAKRFFSEASGSNRDNPLKFQTSMGFDRTLELPVLGEIGNNVTFTRTRYDSGRLENILTYRTSKNFAGLSLNNSITHSSDNLGIDQMNGVLVARGSFGQFRPSIQADYSVLPHKSLDRARLSALYPISKNFTGESAITKDLDGDMIVGFENTVTYNGEEYKLSLTGRTNDEGAHYVGVDLSTSIGRVPGSGRWIVSGKPIAESGTVAAEPFLDENYNLQKDGEEKGIPEATIQVGSQNLETDETGVAVATRLPVDVPVMVGLDQKGLQDPYQRPPIKTFGVVPRPGAILSVTYPISETSQIEGIVSTAGGASVSGIRVDLVNPQGQPVAIAHTSFDGYYLFEGVMPGAYTVELAADTLDTMHLAQPEQNPLVVGAADFYTRDITTIVSVGKVEKEEADMDYHEDEEDMLYYDEDP